MKRTTSALLCGLLFACPKARVHGVSGHIVVAPDKIDFGTSPVLMPVTHTATIANNGTAPLHILAVSLAPAGVVGFCVAAGDTCGAGLSGFDIKGGESAAVKVTFAAPEEKTYTATLVIDSDDPDRPTIEVPLRGTGSTVAAMTFSPASIDFGRVGEGHTGVQRVRINSTGTADLAITKLVYEDGSAPELGFVGSVKTPAIVPAAHGGQADNAVDIVLRFSPTSKTVTPSAGALLIDTSDPKQQHLRIPITATVNYAPLAVIDGGDQQVPLGQRVTLDGSKSSDPDHDNPLSFHWTLRSKPTGSSAVLTDSTKPQVGISTDLPGAYVIELVVVDAATPPLPSLVPARVTIAAVPPEHLRIELVWDQPFPDLDTHLIADGGTYGGAKDCTATSLCSDFSSDPSKNPQYVDDLLGESYGPEAILYKDPIPGKYSIAVNYYADHGNFGVPVNATLRVYEYGVVVSEFPQVLNKAGAVWNVCTVDWPGGGGNSGITKLGTVTGN